jgi:hypothetical protein
VTVQTTGHGRLALALLADQAGRGRRGEAAMTHADLVNDALLWFLIVMTLLLVMCVAAVFFAPAEAASSPVSPRHKAPAGRPAVADQAATGYHATPAVAAQAATGRRAQVGRRGLIRHR